MNSDSPKHEMSDEDYQDKFDTVGDMLVDLFNDNEVEPIVGQNLLAHMFSVQCYDIGLTQFQAIDFFITILKKTYEECVEREKNGH